MTPTIQGPYRAKKRRWWQSVTPTTIQVIVWLIVLGIVLGLCKLGGLI